MGLTSKCTIYAQNGKDIGRGVGGSWYRMEVERRDLMLEVSRMEVEKMERVVGRMSK